MLVISESAEKFKTFAKTPSRSWTPTILVFRPIPEFRTGAKCKKARAMYADANAIFTSKSDELWSVPLPVHFVATIKLVGFEAW
jgi:hypothetical protein